MTTLIYNVHYFILLSALVHLMCSMFAELVFCGMNCERTSTFQQLASDTGIAALHSSSGSQATSDGLNACVCETVEKCQADATNAAHQ